MTKSNYYYYYYYCHHHHHHHHNNNNNNCTCCGYMCACCLLCCGFAREYSEAGVAVFPVVGMLVVVVKSKRRFLSACV